MQENLDAEIMQVILEDAKEAYDDNDDDDDDDDNADEKNADDGESRRNPKGEIRVIELQSDGPDNLDENIKRIRIWLHQWLEQRSEMESS